MNGLDVDVAGVPREQLPVVLAELAKLEAQIRLRLAESPDDTRRTADRLMTADEAATVIGVSKRWLLSKTKGRRFRHDLSRKAVRFEEAGLRAWLASRRTR